MADEFHAKELRGLCYVCGVLIFKNDHEVSLRVGDMSRTFYHLFDMIYIPRQISHTCLGAGNIFLVKEKHGYLFLPRRYRRCGFLIPTM